MRGKPFNLIKKEQTAGVYPVGLSRAAKAFLGETHTKVKRFLGKNDFLFNKRFSTIYN